MSDTFMRDDLFGEQVGEARSRRLRIPRLRHTRRDRPARSRARRVSRVIALTAVALVVLAGVVAGAGYFYVDRMIGSIHRINGITALTAADQPAMPVATRRSQTVLLTGSDEPVQGRNHNGALGSSTNPQDPSGLISLIHLNADHQGGAVVSIPGNVIVKIRHHGRMKLESTLVLGGPSLLIRTVERLTHVRIDHYAVLDFGGLHGVIHAMKGVKVRVPYAFTSEGHHFRAGINHLTSKTVLPYVRQSQVSDIGRVLLQQNLIRAMLRKFARQNMFERPTVDFAVLSALTRALSVDSSFTNREIVSLAVRLGHLDGRDGTFVSAPTLNGSPVTGDSEPVFLNHRISKKLWRAIRHDAVRAFALRYPFTITPGAPG